MNKQFPNLLSSSEQKLLLALGLIVFLLFIWNATLKTINYHNSQVEKDQQHKLKQANKVSDGKTIDFELYDISRGLTIYEIILLLQIFTIPTLFHYLWKFNNKISSINIPLLISFFNLFGYLFWIYASYVGRKGNEVFNVATDTFQSYLMINANSLDILLFIFFIILSNIQMFCLLRFVVERFQAKIPLDDKTSGTRS